MIISINQNPRTTKVLSNFLFGQAFVSAKNLLQQIITFCIKLISYFQIIPFGKRSLADLMRRADNFSIQRISSAATRCHVGRIT